MLKSMSFDDHDGSGSIDSSMCHDKPYSEQREDPFDFENEVIL